MPKIPGARKLRALVLQVFGAGPAAVCIHQALLDGLEVRIESAKYEIPGVLPVVFGWIGRFLQVIGHPLVQECITMDRIKCRLYNHRDLLQSPAKIVLDLFE